MSSAPVLSQTGRAENPGQGDAPRGVADPSRRRPSVPNRAPAGDLPYAAGVLSRDELEAFFRQVFPQAEPERFVLIEVSRERVVFQFRAGPRDLRPGNTVSGPLLMALADTGVYLAVLAHIGRVALAVTTSLNIDFLRKAEAGLLTVETRLLKLGKRLAVGRVEIFSEHVVEGPVAHATATYSIPPGAPGGSAAAG